MVLNMPSFLEKSPRRIGWRYDVLVMPGGEGVGGNA